MRQYIGSRWILIILAVVSGCGLLKTGENDTYSHTVEPTGKPTLFTPASTILPVFTISSTSTGTPYPSVTTQSKSIPTAISTGIPSSQETKTTLTVQTACPARLSPASLSLLHEGSILFSYRGVGTSSGVWAISATNSIPTLVSESLSDYLFGAVLSPDGVRLAYVEYPIEPIMVILYDLSTRQLINIPKQEDWRIIREWLPDGRLKILTDLEEVEMVGIKYQYDLFEPVTELTDEITEVYELPEFQFIPNRWWSGFASIDPSRALVLYTAYVNHLTDIVLRDASTNEDIWRYSGSSYMSNIPIANWSSDGRMVTFVIAGYRNESNNIMSLQIDSLNLTEVASVGGVVRRLSWSSDNRYLHYSVFLDSWNEGPGYIVDTHNHTQLEICSAGYLFNEGTWVKGTDLMLYALQSPTSTRVELLDVSKWETQMLAELGPDSYVDLIGWTPITLP